MPADTLLAVSHGTSSPQGRAAVARLVEAVRAAARQRAATGGSAPARVRAGFVDVEQPDVPALLATLGPGERAVVVPLLLSAGYHVHVDIAGALAPHADTVALAGALGPDDRLVAVLARRLAQAGLQPGDAVVLAAAGSSDDRAVADCRSAAAALAQRLGRRVDCSFLSAAEPSVAEAVRSARSRAARVVVASYLLAPGYFLDLTRQAGADAVALPLTCADDTPSELVEVILDRFAATC